MAFAAVAALICSSAPANALLMVLGNGQPLTSAVWNNNGNSDFGDPLNWTPNSVVPNFVATFTGTPAAPVVLPNYMDGAVQTINFASNAGAYTIQTSAGFAFTIGEIVNASANVQTFEIINSGTINFGDTKPLPANILINVISGSLNFFDGSSAGYAAINISTGSAMTLFGDLSSGATTATLGNAIVSNSGTITFLDSTAVNATILNSGTINFYFSANAGTATFTNYPGAVIEFNDTSSAANATFKSDGRIDFNGASTAANAKFENYFGARINFNSVSSTEFSTAANATFENYGTINFYGYSTAANATFTVNTGTIQFMGNSTASNATFTNDGVLRFQDDATAGNATITNNNLVQFISNATAGNATINSTSLVQFNIGTTAGNSTINLSTNSGFAQFNDASAGNATITLNDTSRIHFNQASTAANATIRLNDDSSATFNDNSTGANARFIVGTYAILDFSNSTGLLNDGKLSAGSFEGSGTIYIRGEMTVGSNNLSTEFSGLLAECGCLPGSLIKVGTGTFTLSGFADYSGFTEVQQGELRLLTSLPYTSDVTVNGGATLSADGIIQIGGDLTIKSNGVLRLDGMPSFTTLVVGGNVTFENNSRFQVIIDGCGCATLLLAGGNITINGGTVEVRHLPGVYTDGQRFLIAGSYTSGVSGSGFTSVIDTMAFFDFTVYQDPDVVELVLFRNANTFSTFAQTRNQRAVAGALDSSDPSSALIQALSGLTNEQAQRVLDLLSGEIYATMAGAFIDESRLFRGAILSRLRATSFAGFSGPLGYLADETNTLAYSAPTQARNPFRNLRPVDRGFEHWAQAFGSWAKYSSDSNAASAKRASGGFVVGLDKMLVDGVRAGLSAGYSNTVARINDRASKSEADTFHLAAYLSKLDGRWSYRTGAALAVHNVKSERSVQGLGLYGDYFAFTGQVFGEAAYAMTFRQIAVEPFANVALVHHYTNGFTETGQNFMLTTSGFDKTLALSTIGMRFATRYTLSNNWVLIPRASVAWQHAFGNVTPTATLNFQNTGTGMTIAGTPLSRDMLLTETGFDIRITPFESLGFFYAATVATDSVEHALRGRYEWRF